MAEAAIREEAKAKKIREEGGPEYSMGQRVLGYFFWGNIISYSVLQFNGDKNVKRAMHRHIPKPSDQDPASLTELPPTNIISGLGCGLYGLGARLAHAAPELAVGTGVAALCAGGGAVDGAVYGSIGLGPGAATGAVIGAVVGAVYASPAVIKGGGKAVGGVGEFLHQSAAGLARTPSTLLGPSDFATSHEEDDRVQGGITAGIGVGLSKLGHGVWDGVSGLVAEPITGAQEDGLGGLAYGVVKGVSGLACKPAAGALGLGASVVQGVSNRMRDPLRAPMVEVRGAVSEMADNVKSSVEGALADEPP